MGTENKIVHRLEIREAAERFFVSWFRLTLFRISWSTFFICIRSPSSLTHATFFHFGGNPSEA